MAFAAALVAASSFAKSNAKLDPRGQFDCPVRKIKFDDGDSFVCKGEEIRVLGIDTPEIKHPSHGIFRDQEQGREAAAFTKNILKNAKQVSIVPVKRDRYKRTLAHVIVDGELLSVKLVKAGLAYENVSFYGDDGLPQYASQITAAWKTLASKPKFEDPHHWRQKNQKKN